MKTTAYNMNGLHLNWVKTMEVSERLKRNSRRLRKVFMFILLVTPILMALFWIGIGIGDLECLEELPVDVQGDLPLFSVISGFLVSMVPVGFFMYTQLLLARLFALYEKGKIFDEENVACFRGIGWSIIACEVSYFLVNVALGPILTHHLADQDNMQLLIDLDGGTFYTLLAGFSVLTIAWVMDEARKIKEEQELFV